MLSYLLCSNQFTLKPIKLINVYLFNTSVIQIPLGIWIFEKRRIIYYQVSINAPNFVEFSFLGEGFNNLIGL